MPVARGRSRWLDAANGGRQAKEARAQNSTARSQTDASASRRVVVSVDWSCNGLKVALQAAVTPPERRRDAGPHDCIHDLPPRLDRQPVGEHRGATRTGGGRPLVTRSPGEPARRRLYEAPFGQHLKLYRSARYRHQTEQQEPSAKRREHPGFRRGQAILERRPRHLRERPQLVVRAADANDSIPHEGEWSLELGHELNFDWHLPRMLHGKAVSTLDFRDRITATRSNPPCPACRSGTHVHLIFRENGRPSRT